MKTHAFSSMAPRPTKNGRIRASLRHASDPAYTFPTPQNRLVAGRWV
jgi:hypothetical protein